MKIAVVNLFLIWAKLLSLRRRMWQRCCQSEDSDWQFFYFTLGPEAVTHRPYLAQCAHYHIKVLLKFHWVSPVRLTRRRIYWTTELREAIKTRQQRFRTSFFMKPLRRRCVDLWDHQWDWPQSNNAFRPRRQLCQKPLPNLVCKWSQSNARGRPIEFNVLTSPEDSERVGDPTRLNFHLVGLPAAWFLTPELYLHFLFE